MREGLKNSVGGANIYAGPSCGHRSFDLLKGEAELEILGERSMRVRMDLGLHCKEYPT